MFPQPCKEWSLTIEPEVSPGHHWVWPHTSKQKESNIKWIITNSGKDVEGEELLNAIGGNDNWWNLFWKAIWLFLKKLKIELQYHPATSLLGIYPKIMKTSTWKVISAPFLLQHYLWQLWHRIYQTDHQKMTR